MPSKFQSKHTAEEIENILDNGGGSGGASIEVVEDLPATGEENTIYVVPGEDKELPDYSVADAGKFLGVDSHGSLDWVLMTGDYLPLSGGTMNEGAIVSFQAKNASDPSYKTFLNCVFTDSAHEQHTYNIIGVEECDWFLIIGDQNFETYIKGSNVGISATSLSIYGERMTLRSKDISIGDGSALETKLYGLKGSYVYNTQEEKSYQWFNYAAAPSDVYDTIDIGATYADNWNNSWINKLKLELHVSRLELAPSYGSSITGGIINKFGNYSIPSTWSLWNNYRLTGEYKIAYLYENSYLDFFPNSSNKKLKYHGTEVAIKNLYLYTTVLYNSNAHVFMRLSFVSSVANLLDATVTSILNAVSQGLITGVSGIYNNNPIYNLTQGYIEYVGGSVSAVSLNLELDLVESSYFVIGG